MTLEFRSYLLKKEKELLIDPRKVESEIRKRLPLAKNLDEKLYLLILLGRSLINQSKFSSAKDIYFQIYDLAVKNSLSEFEADALQGLAIIETERGELQKAEIHSKNALRIYQSLGILEKEAKTASILGSLFYSQKKLDEALKYLDSIQINQFKHNIQLILQILTNKGLIYRKMRKLMKSYNILVEALNIAKAERNCLWKCIIYYNLAETKLQLGDYQEANEFFQEGIDFAILHQDLRSQAMLSVGQAHLLLLLGKYYKANQLLNNAITIYREIEDPIGYSKALFYSAKFWEIKAQYMRAREFLNKAINVVEETENYEFLAELYIFLAEIEESLGETKNSYENLKIADGFSKKYKLLITHIQILFFRAKKSMENGNNYETEFLLSEAKFISKKENHQLYQIISNLLLVRNLFFQLYQKMESFQLEKDEFFNDIIKLLDNSLEQSHQINQMILTLFIEEISIMTKIVFGKLDNVKEKLESNLKRSQELQLDFYYQLNNEIISLIFPNNSSDLVKKSMEGYLIHKIINLLQDPLYPFKESPILDKNFDEIAMVVYKIDEKIGPMIYETINLDISEPIYQAKVLHSGSLYSITLGQGQLYHQGLFGPLPFINTEKSALIYSQTIRDITQKEKRTKNHAYFLFALIYPENLNVIFYERNKLNQIFTNEIERISEARDITLDFLENLLRIIKIAYTEKEKKD
ncbi:MAG: tetratricopeptide repeat protein [Candidatus Lokiarchaeota archaeon]|nr:tetratricopeptide repeat protein [Candidatus Harpocratesius repetitus]